jgi:hypothetical protein
VAHAIHLAVVVRLHLDVDLLLDVAGPADVLEALRAVLAGRLDLEVAQAEHALEDALLEEDGVDALEGDLDAPLGQHALPAHDPVAGEHEVRADPLDEAHQEPPEVDDDPEGDGDLDEVVVDGDGGPDADDHADDERDPGLDDEPPVRVEVEHDGLVRGDRVLGKRHPTSVIIGSDSIRDGGAPPHRNAFGGRQVVFRQGVVMKVLT